MRVLVFVTMGLWSQVKQWFVMHLFLGYIFFSSGLIVNFLMLFTYLTVWWWNKTLYRKICYYLAYLHWSQFTFLGQWWSGSDCVLYLENVSDFKYFGKEHVLVIMNHKYDIDWLLTWIVCERLGMIAGTKVYAKNSLRYVPLLGWAWIFVETIFLKRDFEKDKPKIIADLTAIAEYPKEYPVTMLLFPEGTRFTEEKHEKSLEVARKKGLPLLQHHLLPRAKGFVVSIQALKGKFPAILDLTLGICNSPDKPNLMSVIRGKPIRSELHVRRLPLENVPAEDESCTKYLFDIFENKDKMFEHFSQTGSFQGKGTRIEIKRRYWDLIVWLMWAIVLCWPVVYYSGKIFLSGSLCVQLSAVAVVVIVSFVVRFMIAQTVIEKGSDYGKHLKQRQQQQDGAHSSEKTD